MTTTTKQKKTPTHDIFDVQDREGKSAFWNKVGAAFENKDASHSVLIYQPGRPDSRALQLRVIDRERRPLKEGADPLRSPTHELFFVVDVDNAPNDPAAERSAKNWRRVGVGFTNRDGSLSLVVDDGERDGPKARFQMRTHKVSQLQKPQDGAEQAAQPDEPSSAAETDAAAPPAPIAQKPTVPRTTVRKAASAA